MSITRIILKAGYTFFQLENKDNSYSFDTWVELYEKWFNLEYEPKE